jgi:hypothetical protein
VALGGSILINFSLVQLHDKFKKAIEDSRESTSVTAIIGLEGFAAPYLQYTH